MAPRARLAVALIGALCFARPPAAAPATRGVGAAFAAVKDAAGSRDLLIVGAGYLGRKVALQWREKHRDARVVGVTRTDASHASLRSDGIEPVTGDELKGAKVSFPYVALAAPPRMRSGGSPEEYKALAEDALAWWSPAARGADGGFVFTSSGGVLAEDSGGVVNEDSAVSSGPGTDPLVWVEKRATSEGGVALRLAGLYDTERGAHAYWLKAGKVGGDPEGKLNLLHYDDAASAVVAALERGPEVRGELFLVADGAPASRRDIVMAARKAAAYAGSAMPQFEGEGQYGGSAGGKLYDIGKIRRLLGWGPRYGSSGS